MQLKFPWARPQAGARRSYFLKPQQSRTESAASAQRPFVNARKFLSYYKPHLPLLAADLACALLVAATALALPLCANYVTKSLLQLPEVPQAIGQVYAMGALMLGMLAIQVLAVFFVDYQGHVMGAKIESEVRKELFEHCQKLSFSFYDSQRVGQLMSRITNDSLWLGELYHHGPEDLAIAALKFFGALIILAFIDPVLTALIAGLTPFAVIYALHFNRRMNVALQASKERIAGVNERVEDSLAGIRVVQSFANEALESQRFAEANSLFLESRKDGYRSEAYFSVGTTTFAQLVTVMVIVVGAHPRADGESQRGGYADLPALRGGAGRSGGAARQFRAALAGGLYWLRAGDGPAGHRTRYPGSAQCRGSRSRGRRHRFPRCQLSL